MKDELHFITEEDGRSLTIINGVVTSIAQPTPLRNTPIGWQDAAVSWERDIDRHGVNRTFTTPFQYVNEGAKIIRHALYRQSYERKLFHLIKYLNPEVTDDDFSLKYDYLYKGEIDLSQAKDEDTQVACPIAEGGVAKLIKANQGTTYTIPFDEDAITINMDGIDLIGQQNYQVLDIEIKGQGTGSIGFYMAMPAVRTTEEGKSVGIAFFDSQFEPWSDYFHYPETSLNYFIEAQGTNPAPITVSLSGGFDLRLTTKRDINYFQLKLIKSPEAEPDNFTEYPLFDEYFDAVGQTKHVDMSLDIVMNPGDRLFFYGTTQDISSTGEIGDFVILPDGKFTALYTNRYATTKTKAFKPYDLFRKLMEKVTGQPDLVLSQLLQDEWNIPLTSGDALRQLDNAAIKTNLNDFIQHVIAAHYAGFGINGGKAFIEPRSVFYDESEPVFLGVVKDLVISPATDYIANTYKIGWPEPQIEDLNGKYAFNCTQIYSTPITRVSRTQEIISAYCADPYEIENTRINFDGKKTTDANSDNKIYAVQVGPADTTDPENIIYPLLREVYDDLQGVPTPSVFNIGLSPKRILMKHGADLRSRLSPFDNQKMKFESTERNADLQTTQGTTVILEKSDVNINSLAPGIYQPWVFEFTAAPGINLVEILEENPNRCFSFEWQGKVFTGFNLKAAQALNSGMEQQFQLLAGPSNDLSKFVR